MRKKGLAVAALIALCGSCSAPRDPSSVVNDVGRAIGSTDLKSIQYSATGFVYNFHQNYLPDGPYPKFYAKYSRSIDFEKGLSREETVRTQAEDPPRGGGNQPLYKEARGATTVGTKSAWGGAAVALTPHGWVKAAAAAKPTMSSLTQNGKTVTVISFTVNDKYKLNGYVNEQNLLERVETWMPNPIVGDTLIEITYGDYRDYNGVKFPARIVQKQGGFPTQELNVNSVQPNAAVAIKEPAAPPQARAESEKVADGVWYLSGAPDPNSQLVEFKDFTVIIESSVTEARALANIAEAKRLVPNKPIKYHLNSHHHSDHAAGLRAFVAEGSTIITHEMNKKFYEEAVLKNPHALLADSLSQNPKPAEFIYVNDKYVLTDGNRSLEIYHVENGHAANLLMSYLPKEKMLFITDIFNDFGVPRPNDPPPGIVSVYYAALGDRVKALNLKIDRIAPSHGKSVLPAERLWKSLEGKPEPPPVVALK